MKKWGTTIYAKAPRADGEIRAFCGPTIDAPSRRLAEEYCQNNGLGYCYVGDEIVAEVGFKTGEITDYETTQNN